jgi:hypothetical protein
MNTARHYASSFPTLFDPQTKKSHPAPLRRLKSPGILCLAVGKQLSTFRKIYGADPRGQAIRDRSNKNTPRVLLDPEDGGHTILRNVGDCLPRDTA